MKKLLILSVLACATPAWADSACIDFQTAFHDSVTRPACDESELPALPEGWEWVKAYVIDLNDPEQWYWASWPITLCP